MTAWSATHGLTRSRKDHMRFGVTLPYCPPAHPGAGDPEFYLKVIQRVEASGSDSIWAGKHVVNAANYTRLYPYAPDGVVKQELDAAYPEVLTWLAWVAGHTSMTKLATSAVLLRQRNHAPLAKIIMGENSPAAAQRAGRLAEGMFAPVADPAGAAFIRGEMDAAATAAGRDASKLELTVGRRPDDNNVQPSEVIDKVKAYQDAGADGIILFQLFDQDPDLLIKELESFSANVVERF